MQTYRNKKNLVNKTDRTRKEALPITVRKPRVQKNPRVQKKEY